MSNDLATRVQDVERRLDAIELETTVRIRAARRELADVRELLAAAVVAEPQPAPEPVWATDVWVAAEPEPEVAAEPRPGPEPRREAPSFDLADLLGARSLAWAGGLVTLLGVVFFFVLAVDNGWIDDVTRVCLGAAASLLVFGAGFWLRRRFGDTYASLAAVGAGIAGGYATLLAAAALYELLPAPAALAVAAAIAASGTAVAILWSSETVAGLGLVGAICVPAVVLVDGRLSTLGTGFAALVLVGAAVVAVRRRWSALLAAAVVASVPQIAAIVLDADGRRNQVVVLTAAFAAAYLAAGLAEHLRRAGGRLEGFPASLIMLGALVAGYGSAFLFDGRAEGVALAVVAAAYLALAAAFWRSDADASALLAAVGLAAAGVTAAQLTSGTGLAVAWAAEAAVLAWLARRIDDERYQLAAFVYLGLAAAHVVAIDAPAGTLFEPGEDAGHGIVAVAALAAAAAAFAWFATAWTTERPAGRGVWAAFSHLLADLRASQRELRALGLALAAVAAVYGGSLAIVASVDSFDRAHVGVAALWSLASVTAVALGGRLGRVGVAIGGLVGSAACVGLAVFDLSLEEPATDWAWLAIGTGLVATATAWQTLVSARRLSVESVVAALLGWIATGVGLTQLVDDGWLVALGLAFAVLAALLRGRARDFASVLALGALADVALGLASLLDGTWLVLAYAGTGAAVALLGRVVSEPRLQLGSAGLLALALGHALAFEAKPDDLFVAGRHPASGTQAIWIAAAALALLAWTLDGPARRAAAWVAAALPVYAVSLAILQLSISFGDRSLESAFQRGHTGVSALWGLVGLGLVTFGVTRRRPALRLGGFALFGIALAKLFLYDLTFLSSITRAFSFLAVGAVLLAAGFVYQRLSDGHGAPA